VCLTGERFPQLRFHRGKLDRQNKYFGPFPSAARVREGMALLQKVFQIRTCENTVFANRSRPCMLHQIQRCSAPCVGLVSEADYTEDVRSAVLFLQGKTTEVLAQLKAQMDRRAQRSNSSGRAAARQDHASQHVAVAAVRRERDGRRSRRRRRRDGRRGSSPSMS
jgi:excinuclease ABC subunit C